MRCRAACGCRSSAAWRRRRARSSRSKPRSIHRCGRSNPAVTISRVICSSRASARPALSAAPCRAFNHRTTRRRPSEKAQGSPERPRRACCLALAYLDDRKNGIVGKRPMRLSTYKAAKRYFELHWAALASRPVASITESEVQTQLRKIIEKHGKTAAARAKSFLSAFYAGALKEGLAKTNPTINTHAIAENPPRD